MLTAISVLLAVAVICQGYSDDALKDEIASLPGASGPLKSKHFSGFLPLSSTKFVHYYYIESERDPDNDDLVFWTNGGPGCSGLIGMFSEMGPWRPTSNSTLESNPFAWTTIANMVFVEQPVGVGFSYTLDQQLLENFNDYRAAVDNLAIIKTFLQRFPERQAKAFYLASESYGGHYIPHWSLQVLNDASDLKDYFRGYLVGNPFTSYASGSIAMINALWGLQLVPKPVWDLTVQSTCDLISHDAYFFAKYLPQCFDLMDSLMNYTEALNPYALDFPVCAQGNGIKQTLHKLDRAFSNSHQSRLMLAAHRRSTSLLMGAPVSISGMMSMASVPAQAAAMGSSRKLLSHQGGSRGKRTQGETDIAYQPCTEIHTIDYLNNPEVQAALHVDHLKKHWLPCSDPVNGGWAFNDYLSDTTHLYSLIFNHPAKRKDFKMLVFSGDSDGVCATVGTQHWIYDIQNANVLSLFQQWHYQDINYGRQAGGFLTQFSGFFSFLTVHYAGHEVPAYQPQRALMMFERYLNGSLFANYDSADGSSAEEDSGHSHHSSYAVFAIVLISLLLVGGFVGLSFFLSPKFNEYVRGVGTIGRPDEAAAAQETKRINTMVFV